MDFFLKIYILLLPLLFFHVLGAQNLVPNGNLEDINICTELHAPCSPSAWFVVKKYVPGGYYHQYPDPAASGTQYFDLTVAGNGNSRQYWQTMLLCKLIPGAKYNVSVKIAAGDIGPNINDIGFYFSDHFIFAANDTLLQPPVYLDFRDATVSKLRHNWFLLKKEFTASTDAGFLIVGNFSGESNRAILKKRNATGYGIDLMIDDISIVPEHLARCPGYQQNKDSLYAIRKRHSGDTVIAAKHPVDSLQKKQLPDTVTTVQAPVIDTLQLSNILFEFDHYVLLNPDTLEVFRSRLTNRAIKKIQVIGYTDDAGTESYNATLSAKRAAEIARLITSKFGVPASIIQSTGKGVSTFYTDKARNRRVDIYVFY